MIGKSFFPLTLVSNFKGVNARDSEENTDLGEWDSTSINIYSNPQGALASRPGFTGITAASIGATTEWCGFYQFDKHSGGSTSSKYIGGASNGKVYDYTSGAYVEIYSGLPTTNDDDERFSFFTLDNTVMIMQSLNEPVVYTGTGSAATFATSVTADFGIEWQRYGWLHSTVDPRLMYYCTTLGDPDSAYTSFLNFDDDGDKVVGACKSGDDMIIGKTNGLYRVQYRGTTPLFKKYRIPTKVGPVCHWVMKEIPDGRMVFLAPDCNFYMLDGDSVISCGDNIQPFVKDGVMARLKYAVSGILYARNQYWCSFTYTSGATQNDRTIVMDWSRPYADKWGKAQYPWFIYSIGANCFAEVSVSGQQYLYHGGYTGKVYKNDTGTNDDGVTFNSTYKSKQISHGDPTLEKKYSHISLSLENQGDWDLTIQAICDGNAATEKNITQNLLTGRGYTTMWDRFNWDEGYWSSESDMDVTREINRQGKVIEISFGTTGLDESWLVYTFSLLAKAIGRGIRRRETS
jgi:hypothetical protein